MILDFQSDFAAKDIKYAIFVGRFQPFLRKTHFQFCLEKILASNLKPILLFGSANESADFEKFNPLNNPLTNEQRLGQFGYVKAALKDKDEDKIAFAGFLEDKFDNDIWFSCLIEKLENYFLDLENGDSLANAAFFRVAKEADNSKDSRLNPPALSHFDEMIVNSPFAAILSPHCDKELLTISATDFRRKNILTNDFKDNVVAYDYIKDLVIQIRNSTSWGQYFNEINLDLTMLDLALYRFVVEMGLDEEMILNSDIQSVEGLEGFLTNLLIK